MSETVPEFKVGELAQAMSTISNQKAGIANEIGIVVSLHEQSLVKVDLPQGHTLVSCYDLNPVPLKLIGGWLHNLEKRAADADALNSKHLQKITAMELDLAEVTQDGVHAESERDELRAECGRLRGGISKLALASIKELGDVPKVYMERKAFTPREIIEWAAELIKIEVER
jgi:hypothetical protein